MLRQTPAAAKRAMFIQSGNRCAFPSCGIALLTTDGRFWGEICHIEALTPGGPRFNEISTDEFRHSAENLILLCPTHHRLIDTEPEIYTASWLRDAKDSISRASSQNLHRQREPVLTLEIQALSTLRSAIEFWEQNKENHLEEFWQEFFDHNPYVLAQALPDQVLKFQDKCYVGGKGIANSGGNLLDFMYVSGKTRNAVLIEIKTPLTRLIGKRYRANTYAMSEDLTGAIVQTLNYREELLKNFYALKASTPTAFTAVAPRCLVLAGSIEREKLDETQRHSFDLFRGNQSTTILTYDELFSKLRDIVDLGSAE